MQKESELSTSNSNDKKESLNDIIGEIIIQPRSRRTQSRGLFYGDEGEGKSGNIDMPGEINNNGEYPATRKPSGTRHRSNENKYRGSESENGQDIVHKKYGGNIKQPLKNVRIMKKSPKTYRVSFIPPRDIKSGNIEIVTVGENGRSNKLSISKVVEIDNCKDIRKSSTGIEFNQMYGNKKVFFEFSLLDNRDYAMEVNVYEHN